MNAEFAGKVAVVTGGTRGIGAAIARRLIERGAQVIVLGREANAAHRLAETVREPRLLHFVAANLSRTEEIFAAARRISSEFSGIDILVNSAGGNRLVPFLDTDPQIFEAMIEVNLRATFFFGQAAAKDMIARRRAGSIINISSISGQRGSTLRAAYGLTKSAVIHLTKVMAVELAEHGIRVNGIAPGPIETRAATERHLRGTRDAYMKTIPLRRYGLPDEVASAAAFLASDEALYITGHILNVDGGFAAAGLMESPAAPTVSPPMT